jgi:hypothetical protein
MPEASLLTDEVRATVGQETPMGRVQVTPKAYRRALEVYTGCIPRNHPAPGEPVPGYVLAALDSEADIPALPSLLPNALLISNEWQFERPLRMGEELESVYSLVAINERFGGRFGYSIDFRTEVIFKDADGNPVARSGRTMTQYSAAEARDGGEA